MNFNAVITSGKLDTQKLELLSRTVARKCPKNTIAPIKPEIAEETRSLVSKIKTPELTSSKMDAEKNEALKCYAMQLEQLVKEQPSNIALRTQLANVRSMLVK